MFDLYIVCIFVCISDVVVHIYLGMHAGMEFGESERSSGYNLMRGFSLMDSFKNSSKDIGGREFVYCISPKQVNQNDVWFVWSN